MLPFNDLFMDDGTSYLADVVNPQKEQSCIFMQMEIIAILKRYMII